MNFFNNKIAVNFIDAKGYPLNLPFDPPEMYPEYTGESLNPENNVYAGVRDTLYSLGLDKQNFGKSHWNPFKEIIKPGNTVFIKPNTVRHNHEGKKDIFSVIIHASILRPIIDFICLALKGEGRIIIGDSQAVFGNFAKAYEISQIDALLEWFRNRTTIPIECFDLRLNHGARTWLYGKWGRKKVEQDPRGYHFVDLGDKSCFIGIDPKRLRIAIASHKNMFKHHSNGKHEYLFPKSFLESDVVINIPKLKTHRRTAVSLAIKNFMGLPSMKDSLPHFMTGSAEEGGDQYIHPSMRKRICTFFHDHIQSSPYIPVKFICAVIEKIIWNTHNIFPFRDDINEAMWHGNDTLWRTLIDLNRAAIYSDKDGTICDEPQRKYFCLLDGIIGGEGDGPISPDPVKTGVLIAGFNPVSVDAVGATLMGFDVQKIPIIAKNVENVGGWNPLFVGDFEDINIIENEGIFNLREYQAYRNLKFEPHPNWKGQVELGL